MNKLVVSYNTIKQVITTAPSYYIPQGDDGYHVFVVGDQNFIICQIAGNDTSSINDFTSNYLSQCSLVVSADDALVLGTKVNGIPLVSPRLPDGRARISSEKPTTTRTSFYSVNWADKTTWYYTSVRNSETVVASVSDGYYYLSHSPIIDVYHGKITQEDSLKDANGYSYRVSVVVDGYTKVEQDPHYGTGGDFIVNYDNGVIVPLTSWNPLGNNSVVITYHYVVNSNFIIKPNPGTALSIQMAECQFSTDIEINDTITFQVQGYAGVFAPQLNLPFTTLIPLLTFKYKGMNDYLNDSVRSYPCYPALSANTWRGMPVSSTVLDWDYVSSTFLSSSKGMQILIYLDHNAVFGGSFATATFYGTAQAE